MDDFYAARSSSMPPLPWPNFSPPFSVTRDLDVKDIQQLLASLDKKAARNG